MRQSSNAFLCGYGGYQGQALTLGTAGMAALPTDSEIAFLRQRLAGVCNDLVGGEAVMLDLLVQAHPYRLTPPGHRHRAPTRGGLVLRQKADHRHNGYRICARGLQTQPATPPVNRAAAGDVFDRWHQGLAPSTGVN